MHGMQKCTMSIEELNFSIRTYLKYHAGVTCIEQVILYPFHISAIGPIKIAVIMETSNYTIWLSFYITQQKNTKH